MNNTHPFAHTTRNYRLVTISPEGKTDVIASSGESVKVLREYFAKLLHKFRDNATWMKSMDSYPHSWLVNNDRIYRLEVTRNCSRCGMGLGFMPVSKHDNHETRILCMNCMWDTHYK